MNSLNKFYIAISVISFCFLGCNQEKIGRLSPPIENIHDPTIGEPLTILSSPELVIPDSLGKELSGYIIVGIYFDGENLIKELEVFKLKDKNKVFIVDYMKTSRDSMNLSQEKKMYFDWVKEKLKELRIQEIGDDIDKSLKTQVRLIVSSPPN